MNHFETMVARYNATLPTLTDGDGQELQLTSRGVLYVTPSNASGNSVIFQDGDDVSGGQDYGFIVYGVNPSNEAQPHSMDSSGNLNVNIAAGSVNVDFTPGTDADVGSDEAGDNSEPGVILGITGSYRTIASISIPNGQTLAVNAFDASCDAEGMFQLVFTNATGSTYVRTLLVPENQGTNQLLFPRPREFAAIDESTSLTLKGKSLRNRAMNATGGINGYIQ